MNTIFQSEPRPNGHSWSITSKFGHILRTAEEKYGERDKSYTLLGIEFTSKEIPQIWYPGNCKHIIIQITEKCMNDLDRAVFQVAHETIHCLFPTEGRNANVLEEGLANLFSIEYCAKNGHGEGWHSDRQEYTDASNLVAKLLELDNDIIKKLRDIQPTLSLIDKEIMLKACPAVTEELAKSLTEKFEREQDQGPV